MQAIKRRRHCRWRRKVWSQTEQATPPPRGKDAHGRLGGGICVFGRPLAARAGVRGRPRAPSLGTKTQSGIQAEAPAGTDPALWSVLSGEERAFFAKAGAMGPLTYGRAFSQMKNAQMPANRGGRLDIKI